MSFQEEPEVLISVGICAYNEENNIGELLQTLLEDQGLPKNSEIIVICSGCNDRTPEIVMKYAAIDPRIKLILEDERRGKAHALNRILSLYRGRIFVHLDADQLPEPKSIERLMRHFNNNKVGAVSGNPTPIKMDHFMGKLIRVVWSLHNATQKYFHLNGVPIHLSGHIFAIRRGICDKVPEDIVNDDAYIGVICRLKNYKIVYDEEARTIFKGPGTFLDYLNQRRRVVYGHLKVKNMTGLSPMVLEECPFRDKIKILSIWLMKNWKLFPHFLVAVFMELIVNILARFDFVSGRNDHKIWKIAKTTKEKVTLKNSHKILKPS